VLDVKTEFLFDIKADLDWAGAVDVGTTPHGMRRIVHTLQAAQSGGRKSRVLCFQEKVTGPSSDLTEG
jgi:hypothetical protein